MTPQTVADLKAEIDLLAEQLIAQAGQIEGHDRYMLGIVGCPGAGKSTTAAMLAETVNRKLKQAGGPGGCMAMPMDGFHRYNADLVKRGLLALKGIPDSFDAEALIHCLQKIRQNDASVACPAFDRAIEEPSPGAIVVEKTDTIVIIEGNYLLLEKPPWDQIKALLDSSWFVETTLSTIEPRLLARHIAGGRTPAEARRKMESTDLPNARLIEASRPRADRVISFTQADSDAIRL